MYIFFRRGALGRGGLLFSAIWLAISFRFASPLADQTQHSWWLITAPTDQLLLKVVHSCRLKGLLRGTILNTRYQVGPTVHTKTYIFRYFHERYLVLFTMVPRNSNRHFLSTGFTSKASKKGLLDYTTAEHGSAGPSVLSVCAQPMHRQ